MKPSILLLGLFDTAIMTARCFKGEKLIVYGMDYNAKLNGFHSNLIKPVHCPNPNKHEILWVNFVRNWLINSKGPFVLIPTSDEFVYFYTKHHEKFKELCSALLPDFLNIKKLFERDKQFEEVKKIGINVPKFIVGPVSIDCLEKEKYSLPLAVKPVNSPEWKSKFNNKGFVISEMEDLKKKIKLLNNYNIHYIVQEIIEGNNSNNYEVNSIYLPNGKIIQHTIRKIRQFPDRFGTATAIEHIEYPELETMANRIIQNMNLKGFTNIEFKLNKRDGLFYYIETNARVWYQVNYSQKIAINFPLMYYNYLTNGKFSLTQAVRNKGKWIDFLPDLLFFLKYKKKYNLSLYKHLKSWFPVISTGLFSLRDFKPFYKDLNISTKIFKIKGCTK